jgi:hypothetical protein
MSSHGLIRKFIELRQGGGTVVLCATCFNELSRYAPFMVASEDQKKSKFISSLRAPLQEKLWPFFPETYSSIYVMALRLEEEMNDCRPRQGSAVRRESHERNRRLLFRQ